MTAGDGTVEIRRPAGRGRDRMWRTAERRARTAWENRPGPVLRGLAALYAGAVDLRHFLFETGLADGTAGPIPIVSVGGLTTGGGGKTPLTAEIAGWLVDRGIPVGVATWGHEDEVQVHRKLNPKVLVEGSADRMRAVRRLVAGGARVALLDSGFQHRWLERDLEIVTVDADSIGAAGARLPAGPYRERLAELGRADALVITRRIATAGATAALADRLRRLFPRPWIGRCELRSTGLTPANAAAADGAAPGALLAFASVMRHEPFLAALARLDVAPHAAYVLPDHATPDERLVSEIGMAASSGGPRSGVVGTLKDVVKLVDRLDARVPLWVLAEGVAWEEDERPLRRAVERLADADKSASAAPADAFASQKQEPAGGRPS